jgi:tRNA modification GTPase
MPEKTEMEETIFAFTTPTGRGGVSVLRLSGSGAKRALESFSLLPLPPPAPVPRVLSFREIGFAGEMIDRGLVVYFRAPHSWTGEDVVEFHLHGGQAIRKAMVAACSSLGLRAAQAGEFSKRAFLNGKADLTELEGLADLVDAETEAQRKQALRQMEGASRAIYENWSARLLSVLAAAEAQLDFPEDVEDSSALALVNQIKDEIGAELAKPYGERLREGIRVALLGGANAGKSTLFNLLVGREAAITSPQAGTTRDVIEAALDIGGYPVILSDLAGLRDSKDEIEAEGVRRAEARAESADLRLILLAPDVAPEENARALALAQKGDLIMVNKTDIGDLDSACDIKFSLTNLDKNHKKFNEKLILRLEELFGVSTSPLITRERHRAALSECQSALSRAIAARAPELRAEDLRLALAALGAITGSVGVEDMLDELFAEFCIGK